MFMASSTMLMSQATNLATPKVINYYKKATKGGTQTWDIAVDSFGFHYFANNAGLLVFDGFQWETYKLSNETIARSVALDHKGRIFVGAQGEFGYFYPNNHGKLQYYSLSQSLNSEYKIGDVWEIIHKDGETFFRTDYQIFVYDSLGKVKLLLESISSLLVMGIIGHDLVVQDDSNAFLRYKNGKFYKNESLPAFTLGRISSIIQYKNDTTLITTNHHGIFQITKNNYRPWITSDDAFLKKNIIYSASYSEKTGLVLGTSFDGVVIVNEARQIVHHLNKKYGTQNNTVLSVLPTHDGNIWLGLDNGIDLVDLNAPYRYFFPDAPLEGTGYCAKIYNEKLYFGTNTGLYSLPWKKYYHPKEKNLATLIPGTSGQVWSINSIFDKLWIGHHNGAFCISEDKVKKITNTMGVWKFIALDEQHILAGYYHGLMMFKKQKNKWQLAQILKHFNESSRIISQDKNLDIWISHPYRGVYFIKRDDLLQDQVKPIQYSAQNPLNKKFRNVFFDVNSDIVLDDGIAFYSFNTTKHLPEKFNLLNNYLTSRSKINYLFSDDYKNIWYGDGRSASLLVPQNTFVGGYKKYELNEIAGLLPGGFESVFTIDPHNVIFPTEKGFIFFDPHRYLRDTAMTNLKLMKVVLHSAKDSVLYVAHNGLNDKIMDIYLYPQQNSLSFYFTNFRTGDNGNITYSYKMKGLHDEWLSLSSIPHVQFSNLPSGHYILSVKATNHALVDSEIIQIPLYIRFPWYRTTLAYGLYALLLVSIGYLFFKRQQQAHEIEKSRILATTQKREEEHLLKAEISKLQITQLQNEKLQTELNYKNQELTSFTYHLVNKNELITEIVGELQRLELKFGDTPELKKSLHQILKLTEQNADVDADWENFIKSFDQVHVNFFKRLHDEFEELSPNDYKMCTYLRMNLNTKEIATLMNISIRSVETNRYRLRKKLGIDGGTNLTQFLMDF